MSYQVGIDVGTTFTAAAVHRGGAARIFPLSEQRIVVPTMVARSPDGQLLVGWSAARQLREHPERVVHSFKRRIGDRTPIPLDTNSFEPSWYVAQILGAVIAELIRREGEPPSRVALTHPANWNAHKIARLLQAASTAGLNADATVLLSEPEAAAMAHATTAQIADGTLIAVYDLGGGSFDTAVLRRTRTAYEIVGLPEGIERLGGLDFDATLFRYATDQLARMLPAIDPDDPAAASALAQLHLDCVAAKEALSFEPSSDLTLSVNGRTASVTIERRNFEALVRPALMETIGALRRCLATARISTEAVTEVLLTGGSSQIPLVAELLSQEMGRPVSVHDTPKELVALGAAHAAAVADGALDASGSSAGPTDRTNGAGAPAIARLRPSSPDADVQVASLGLSTPSPTSAAADERTSRPRLEAPPPTRARPPAAAANGGNGRPPSLLAEHPADRHEPGVGSEPAVERGSIAGSFEDDARRSLIIGVIGALAFVLVVAGLVAALSMLG